MEDRAEYRQMAYQILCADRRRQNKGWNLYEWRRARYLEQHDKIQWESLFPGCEYKGRKERIVSMRRIKFTRNIGMLLLAIWLIAWGLISLIPALGGLAVVLAILAIAAGVFILIGR
jgi:hypothetical protein